MLYSQDGLGLGHLRRTSSIAAALVRARPDASVLTVADSPLGQFFGRTPNQDHVKLPSIRKLGPGAWEPVGLPLPFGHVNEVRREALRALATSYRPDLLLVDHMPHGAMGELYPTLEDLRRNGTGTRVVLGLRDILDAPEVVKRVWSEEGAFDALERFYDRVLVYGRQEVFDLGGEYGFPEHVAARMRYTGYVCTQSQPRYAGRVRAEHTGSGGDRALVVVTAGGGADGHPMMRVVLDALEIVRATRPCGAVLIAGPFMPSRLRRDLERTAKGTPTKVRASVSDSLSYMHAADAVVLMAGYNSSIEVLRAGTPSILVPRVGPSAEQRTRARLFAEHGWARVVDPESLAPETLAAALLETLEPAEPDAGTPRPDPPPLGGLDVAVGHLLALLDDDEEPLAASAGAVAL